jgi:hypothetical protein
LFKSFFFSSGIFVDRSGSLKIQECKFTGNQASNNGGAAYISPTASVQSTGRMISPLFIYLLMTRLLFVFKILFLKTGQTLVTSNIALNGGGIFLDNGIQITHAASIHSFLPSILICHLSCHLSYC